MIATISCSGGARAHVHVSGYVKNMVAHALICISDLNPMKEHGHVDYAQSQVRLS